MESSALARKFSCCGIPISLMDLEVAVFSILADVHQRKPRTVRFLNAYTVSCAFENINYLEELTNEGLNLLDSKNISLIYGLLFSGLKPINQIRGYDFLLKTLQDRSEIRHIFIGSTDETLKSMRTNILELFPWQADAIFYSPPFINDVDKLVSEISVKVIPNENDLIWVSLGTPKQDQVALKLFHEWNVTVVAVGAAFNYLAGNLLDCPKIVRQLGFEWLFRLYLEPRRLWRRYLFGNMNFINNVFKHFLVDKNMNFTKRKNGEIS